MAGLDLTAIRAREAATSPGPWMHPPEILTPPALARMPGAHVVDRCDGTHHVVDHVEHPAGQEYLIFFADGTRMFAGARHPYYLDQP